LTPIASESRNRRLRFVGQISTDKLVPPHSPCRSLVQRRRSPWMNLAYISGLFLAPGSKLRSGSHSRATAYGTMTSLPRGDRKWTPRQQPAQGVTLSDHLAAERTLLAWIRTGLALMGFGFVVARFGLFHLVMVVLDVLVAIPHTPYAPLANRSSRPPRPVRAPAQPQPRLQPPAPSA
jgi:Domain of unknown function (DUF202)